MEKARVTKSILKRDQSIELSNRSKSTVATEYSDSDESNLGNDGFKPRVSFSSIEIRDYDITLGDNPSCLYGPPVSLDWEYDEQEPVCINEYEQGRGSSRRYMHEMHMLARRRTHLLKAEAGVTDDEIAMVVGEMKKIRKGRKMTKRSLPLAKLQEIAESGIRKWQRNTCKVSS